MTPFYDYQGKHPAVADRAFCRKFWIVVAAVALLLIAGRHRAHAEDLTIDTRASDGSRITTTIGPSRPGVTIAPESPADEILICEGAFCRSRPVPKGHFVCEYDHTCGQPSGPLIWYRNKS